METCNARANFNHFLTLCESNIRAPKHLEAYHSTSKDYVRIVYRFGKCYRDFLQRQSHTSLLRAEQPASSISYAPRSSKGSMVITVRDARIGERLADRILFVVQPLEMEEAKCL